MLFKRKKEFPGGFDAMIVGLGNPGEKYESTRHNAGFMAVEGLASRYGCRLKKLKCKMLYGDCVIEGRKVLLCEPQTYMNNSGEAVRDFTSCRPSGSSCWSTTSLSTSDESASAARAVTAATTG